MLKLSVKTNRGKQSIHYPEWMGELTVGQLQDLVEKWDFEDWVQGFSIVSGIEADAIAASTDGSLEGALYETIAFMLDKREWEKLNELPIPEKLTIQPIWFKDCDDLIPKQIELPKKIGKLPIGQAIQARRHLQGLTDLREGISMVTAIYLQPLLDSVPSNGKMVPGKFDMLQVIKYEYIIKKMYVQHIYPIGFFLLRKLNEPGSWWENVLNRLRRMNIRRGKG